MALEISEPESRCKPSVSFGFSRRKENKVAQNPELRETAAETDYVSSLEGNTLQSVKPKEENKPLVIPLIKRNQWRKSMVNSAAGAAGSATDDLEKAAVQELLDDARRHAEGESKEEGPTGNLAIPLLLQNKIPGGYETDDKLDVSLRPEEPADADYERVPIEEYGLAMLRGMGWKQGEGVGKNRHLTKPVEAVLRPKGMGLGADRSALLQDQQEKHGSRSSKGRKPGDEPRTGADDERPLTFTKGTHCVVERGSHKDLYGIIEGVDEDNCRCMVKLAIGNQSVSLSQYALKLVQKTEYEKFSRCINQNKYDQYARIESAKHKESRDSVRDSSENGGGGAMSSSSAKAGSLKRKHGVEGTGSGDSGQLTSPRTSNAGSLWLQQLLRVRLVDKHYRKGTYYNSKMIVEDVLSTDSIICRTDDGKVLDGIRQAMLETVVPRDESSLVMIVTGKSKGQLAEIIKKDKAKCVATVQLVADRDQVRKLSYDDICEWTGDAGHLLDY